MKERPEKFWSKWDLNPDLYDASGVLVQLNYQANWEPVIMWVNDKYVDIGYTGSHL